MQVSAIQRVERQPKRPTWRKCRRPYFWMSIVALFAIGVDALFEQFLDKSLFESNHWIALRFMDLILSISVFLQGKKLENLLDEKEELFLSQGYERGRHSSPFIEMRRKQLKVIAHSYLASNIFVLLEILLIFSV